jgi:hypothetical protein
MHKVCSTKLIIGLSLKHVGPQYAIFLEPPVYVVCHGTLLCIRKNWSSNFCPRPVRLRCIVVVLSNSRQMLE